MRYFLFAFILFFAKVSTYAQTNVGQWRDHLPYHQAKKVTKIGTKAYVATSNNIFTFESKDNSMQKLSTITGLSEIGISTMEYNASKDILVIAYASGNIDLIQGQTITNIPDLKNKIITGSKEANSIFFKDDLAYICYPFGILVLNLDKDEIKDTWSIGTQDTKYNIYAITADANYYYAATSGGIFKASLTNPLLVNYSNWHLETNIPNPTGRYTLITLFNNVPITNSSGNNENSDTLLRCVNGIWSPISTIDYQRRYELRVFNDKLAISEKSNALVLDANYKVVYSNTEISPRSFDIDGNGDYWLADTDGGLKYKRTSSSIMGGVYPNGPYFVNVGQLAYNNGSIYVTGGGVDGAWANLWNAGYLFKFQNETWTDELNYKAQDYMYMAFDPANANNVYVGTWGAGLWQYTNDKVAATYNINNSTLQSVIANDSNTRVSGLIFDTDQNLWVVNSGVTSPISVMKKNGKWKSFKYGQLISTPTQGPIIQDAYGQFWMVVPRGGGLFVFDPKVIDNDDDDVTPIKFFPQDAYKKTVSNIFCITTDRNNYVWIGTDHGPIYFSSPENVFNGETSGEQVKIPRNDGTDNVDPLLDGETVNCITVDGANRKWFGTVGGGAFCCSADGTKQIYHFSITNSPIFSNNVRSIAINDQTGEVFFGTDKGVISFRASATKPTDDFTNVYVYPNPVRPDYNGDIVITGLIENCHVKITDISGNLVYACKSDGGSAVWNGKIKGGHRAASGVYLVFLSNDDGSKIYQTKFLMIH